LEHAILGFLDYRPLSGYDLKAMFEASVKHFWPADQSQIYRTLARLSDTGLTRIELVEQTDRPDRKVYHITDAGREELHRWLTGEPAPSCERIASLVQIFFAGGLSDDEVLSMLRRHAERNRSVLERLRAIPAHDKPHVIDASAKDKFFWMLTLDYGIKITETAQDWLEDVIARIELGEHGR